MRFRHPQPFGKAQTGYGLRFFRCLGLASALVLGEVSLTWAGVYECKGRSGGAVFTDSPSQLDQCKSIATTPAAPPYPGNRPLEDPSQQFSPPPPPAPGLPTTWPAPSVPVTHTNLSEPGVDASQPPVVQPPPAVPPTNPGQAPTPGMALNPIHPFLPPVPAPAVGTEQRP